MTDIPAYGKLPGMGTISQTTEKVVWWGREEHNLYIDNLIIDSTAVDAGNSPTTELRAGLILGKQTSDGNLYQWNPDGTDGTEVAHAVLLRDISMLDANGVVEDKYAHVLLAGSLKAADLLIEGTAFTTSTDEHLARRQLVGSGKFIIDDELSGGATFLGGALRNVQITTTTHSPTAASNGTRFTYSNAASVTITLPTLESGLVFEFLRTADEEFIVASAAGDDMVVGNDLSADSITYTTASEHIGALIRVESIFVGTTLKWLVTIPQTPFGTAAGSEMTISIAT